MGLELSRQIFEK